MTTPVSLARGCEWGGLIPPGAKSTRFIAIPRVFSPGNVRTFAGVREDAKMLLVLPSLVKPSKKKSSKVTSDAGLQGKPLTDIEALMFATQKSCKGSGSAECEGGIRSQTAVRQHSRWKRKLVMEEAMT